MAHSWVAGVPGSESLNCGSAGTTVPPKPGSPVLLKRIIKPPERVPAIRCTTRSPHRKNRFPSSMPRGPRAIIYPDAHPAPKPPSARGSSANLTIRGLIPQLTSMEIAISRRHTIIPVSPPRRHLGNRTTNSVVITPNHTSNHTSHSTRRTC